MANTNKITKKDVLNAIKDFALQYQGDAFDATGKVSAQDVIDYVDVTIDQLERKAAAAKARAEKAKAEGDELRDKIEGVLTEDLQTIPQIVAQLDVEDITPAKVTARLTQLIKAGKAHKDKVKTSDSRKINGYALGAAPAEDAE
jgi:hypothetical protein